MPSAVKDIRRQILIMDAIGCQRHPKADPHTGVAHACGHHAQMAVMAGAAIAFSDPEIRREISGSLTFLAVPAEEYIDADKRTVLREQGIRFGSGKSEMIRTGVFDRTDLVMTTHVHMVDVKEDFYLGNPACNGFNAERMTTHVHMVDVKEDFYLGNPACNGFNAERVTVRGKAAHAAIDPWNGVNALSITSSAIQMMGLMRETFREEDHVRLHNVIRKAGDVVNSVPDEAVVETKIRASSLERIQEIRETFREEDHVRLHNVIRKAGDVVNSVPDEAVVETKIRASSLERIQEICQMVDRAYDGAAYAFGGKIERENLPGYMPIRPRMADTVLVEAAEELGLVYRNVQPGDFNNACTDVGDLTQLFPVINFTFRGFEGRLHGEDFHITDKEKAYILPAKLMALTIYRLLRKNGEEAKKIKESFTAVFDKQTYIEYIEKQM